MAIDPPPSDLPPDTPPGTPLPAAAVPPAADNVDPRLLERALKRMKGLIEGNGENVRDITLAEHNVRILRFGAQTILKLVTEHGIKPEPGRNTIAELVTTEEDFRRTLALIPQEAASNPLKRQQIIDTVFARSDKGFGLSEQKIGFHTLNRTLVRHEKCVTCKGIGKNDCARCHGEQLINCVTCLGHKQVICPLCRGSTHMQTPKGTQRCTKCHGEGRIMCLKCAGRGRVKCPSCKGHGALNCQNCAATGWISHMALVKLMAQIRFTFEKDNLPDFLVKRLEHHPARLVEKHDIEVALKTTLHDGIVTNRNGDNKSEELNDHIIIDYNVTCPTGPIALQMDEGGQLKTIAGSLLGYQGRLINMPPFLEQLTQLGYDALKLSAGSKSIEHDVLERATRYALITDIFLKLIVTKSPQKSLAFLSDKYSSGIRTECLRDMVSLSLTILKTMTRRARYIGMASGLILYGVLDAALIVYLAPLLSRGFAISLLALLPVIGAGLGVLAARMSGILAQRKHFSGIITDDILRSHLPQAGNALWWSIGSSVLISAVIGFICYQMGYLINLTAQ